MTDQEVFDLITSRLLAQDQQSFDGAQCRYRFNNLKCAAGYLIPDDLYSEKFEGISIRGLCGRYSFKNVFGFEPQTPATLLLISSLQLVHDYSGPDQWSSKFVKVAKRFDLEYNE